MIAFVFLQECCLIAGLCAEVVESASDEPDGRTETDFITSTLSSSHCSWTVAQVNTLVAQWQAGKKPRSVLYVQHVECL